MSHISRLYDSSYVTISVANRRYTASLLLFRTVFYRNKPFRRSTWLDAIITSDRYLSLPKKVKYYLSLDNAKKKKKKIEMYQVQCFYRLFFFSAFVRARRMRPCRHVIRRSYTRPGRAPLRPVVSITCHSGRPCPRGHRIQFSVRG